MSRVTRTISPCCRPLSGGSGCRREPADRPREHELGRRRGRTALSAARRAVAVGSGRFGPSFRSYVVAYLVEKPLLDARADRAASREALRERVIECALA